MSKDVNPPAAPSSAASGIQLGQSPPQPTVVRFPRKKRPRGRPPIDHTPTPCTDGFEMVAAAVAGIPSKLWPAARHGVELRAAADRRLAGSARATLTFLLSVINRRMGYDWHSMDAISDAIGYPRRTIIRALQQLLHYGYALRRTDLRHGQTTLPALVLAYLAEAHRREALEAAMVTKKSALGDKKMRADGDTRDTQILESNPTTNLRARSTDFSNPEFKGKPAPRYDRSRPLRERLEIPPSYTANPHGEALRQRMVEAGNGRDPDKYKSQFCAYFNSADTHDAVEAFIGWLSRLGGSL